MDVVHLNQKQLAARWSIGEGKIGVRFHISYRLAVETGVIEMMTVDRNDFERSRLSDGRAFFAAGCGRR